MPPDVRLDRGSADGRRVLHVRLAGTVDALDLYPAHVAGVLQLRNGRRTLIRVKPYCVERWLEY